MTPEEFVAHNRTKFMWVINHFTNHKTQRIREDMINEAWIAILEYEKKVGELTEDTPFPILQIKHRLCLLILGNKQVSGMRSTDIFSKFKNCFDYHVEITELVPEMIWRSGLYQDDWDRIDTDIDVSRAFDSLDKEEQEIARLLSSGYKKNEIKELLGVTRYKIDTTMEKLEDRLEGVVAC